MNFISLKYITKLRKRGSGRNNQGRTTVYHRGGGQKLRLRVLDHKRAIWGVKGYIYKIESDSFRSAKIALVCYQNGLVSYVPLIDSLKVGDFIISGEKVPLNPGNSLPLKNIPVGTIISNIEIKKGYGAQLARAAGSYCRIIQKNEKKKKVLITVANNKRFVINSDCVATVGIVGNISHKFFKYKNAGSRRNLGYRPIVRGVAMNPVDHPMGGGEGKTSGGRCSVSPWGILAKGGRTRKKKKNDFFFTKKKSNYYLIMFFIKISINKILWAI